MAAIRQPAFELDGSRFPNVRQAEMTVQRLSNFVDHPPTANAA